MILLIRLFFVLLALSHASAEGLSPPDAGPVEQKQEDRIVGGQILSRAYHHALVSIRNRNGVHSCGGTILNEWWMITAAHCISKQPDIYGVELWMGVDHVDHTSTNELQKRRIQRIIYADNYNLDTQSNDIALIKFSQSLVWTPTVQPVHGIYPFSYTDAVRDFAMYVMGWGNTQVGGYPSTYVRYITPTVWQQSKCDDELRKYGKQPHPSKLCAGGTAGVDACYGDSGGPMLLWLDPPHSSTEPSWLLYGVVSGSLVSCGDPIPGIYANVARIKSWVDSNISQ